MIVKFSINTTVGKYIAIMILSQQHQLVTLVKLYKLAMCSYGATPKYLAINIQQMHYSVKLKCAELIFGQDDFWQPLNQLNVKLLL